MENPLTKDINPDKIATDYKGDLTRLIPTIDVAFVGSLLKDVFGVESPVYLPTWWQGREFHSDEYPGVKVRTDELNYDKAPIRFGQPVFGAFWLKGGKYPSYNQYTGALEKLYYSDFLMPLATLIDFSRPKVVTKTPTVGSGGTVKEIYGLDDWSISIKGIIIPDDNNAPSYRSVAGQKMAMQKFNEIVDSIEVEGQIFAERNISRITIENLTFSPIQGKPNMMQYTIDACSDEDILLML